MNPIFVVAVIVLAVIAVAASFYRLRKGGPGPNTGWFPRSMRGKVNQEYEKKGWEKPYRGRAGVAARGAGPVSRLTACHARIASQKWEKRLS